MQYSVIVFDTAPTGHTLRFLSFPSVLQKALGKLSSLRNNFGPMMSSMSSMMGVPTNTDEMFQKLDSMREVIDEVNSQFKDPEKTTFVCVCIVSRVLGHQVSRVLGSLTLIVPYYQSEFLSLYETERLIQELTSYSIDTHAIVVNQLLGDASTSCNMCASRWAMQKKYLGEINELYAEDFNVVRVPLLVEEVRGSERIKQ